MRSHILALHRKLALCTGLGVGAAVGGCLEHVSLEECLEAAEEDSEDRVDIVSLRVGAGELCPAEDAAEVKRAARQQLSHCENAHNVRYVACGPVVESLDTVELCSYVVVYGTPVGDCPILGGRPFLVAGAPRRARACTDARWPACVEFEPPAAPHLRAALARHYTQAGLVEHASVAAFARFGLQLLALGAPAQLQRACHAAIADELRHAQQCFGVATRLGGRPVAPGALAIEGAVASAHSPEQILREVVLEGCLGETRAALELRVAADHCDSPQLAAILRAIAADEERHAALAWRFVAWLLRARPALATSLNAVVAQILARPCELPEELPGGEAWGVSRRETLLALDSAVKHELLAPLAVQLSRSCARSLEASSRCADQARLRPRQDPLCR